MRSRTIYDKHGDVKVEIVNGVVTYCRDEIAERVLTHHVMPEIAPYKSMITGEIIESRMKHRDHLERHNCFEVGNEVKHLDKRVADVDPQGRRELIARQIKGMGHKGFKQALNREIEHIKWNSRGLPRSEP